MTSFTLIQKVFRVSFTVCLLMIMLYCLAEQVHAQGSGNVVVRVPQLCPGYPQDWTYFSSDVFSAVNAATRDTIPMEWWPAPSLGGTITLTGLKAGAVIIRTHIMFKRFYFDNPDYYTFNIDTRQGYSQGDFPGCVGSVDTVLNAGINYGQGAAYPSSSAVDSTSGEYIVSQGGVNPIKTGWLFEPVARESTKCGAQSDDWRYCAISALGVQYSLEQNRYAWRVNTQYTDKFKFEAEAYYEKTPSASDSWNFSTSDAGYLNKGYMVPTPNDGTGYGSDVNFPSLSPQLKFHVAFPNAVQTRWYIWARGRGCGGNDDSIHFGLNGNRFFAAEDLTGWSSCSYTWQSLRANGTRPYIDIPAPNNSANGTSYTVNLWMREDGMRVDRILFTTSASYNPANDPWATQSNNLQ